MSSATCRSEPPPYPPQIHACARVQPCTRNAHGSRSSVQCVLWIVGSYCDGQCPDYYMARYNLPYAPSRRDVVTWAACKARSLRLPTPEHGEEAPLCPLANFALVIPESAHGTLLPPQLRACSKQASELAEACLKEPGWCVPMEPVRRLKQAVSKAQKDGEKEWKPDPIVIAKVGKEADVGENLNKEKVRCFHPIEIHLFFCLFIRPDYGQSTHTRSSQEALSKTCIQASKKRRQNQEVNRDDGSGRSRKEATKKAKR